jgi:hypothetical protein
MSMNATCTRKNAPVRAAIVPVWTFDVRFERVKLEACATECRLPSSAAWHCTPAGAIRSV